MSASIYLSNYVLFAKFHFSRSPHSLWDFIYFLKNAGGRSKCKIALLKKSNKMNKIKKIVKVCK